MTFYLVALIAYSLSKSTLFARVSKEVSIIYRLLLTALALFAWLMETIGKQQLQVWQVGLMVVLTCLPVLFVGWFMNLFQTKQINYSLLVLGILICLLVISRSPYPVYFSPEIGMPSWAIALIVFTLLLILPSISETYWKIPLLIGSISYPLYVFHVPISQLVEIVAISTASKFAIFWSLFHNFNIGSLMCRKTIHETWKVLQFPKKVIDEPKIIHEYIKTSQIMSYSLITMC